jgi:hypothetical protein
MIYHVLPGDAVAAEFKKAAIGGKTIVCRECFIVGPVDADDPMQFWDERAQFVLTEYGEDEIDYQERVADELERLTELEPGDEVNLWFEYELFCQTNMWFCISLLAGTGAEVYRVEPAILSRDDRWQGFGAMSAKDLRRCFDQRTRFSDADLQLGRDLWTAYRTADRETLGELAEQSSLCFPYMDEVVDAELAKETLPREILHEIIGEGNTEFSTLFAEFSRRAGVYGFGDLQVQRLLDRG